MKDRFEVLDVFRGLAALSVAVYHYSDEYGNIKAFPFIHNSHRFVDFFFVLSGFIIYYNYKNITTKKDQISFIKKRVYRLYPLHFIMLMLFLFFEILKSVLFNLNLFNKPAFINNSWIKFIQNVFMLQGFARNYSDFSWNYPSWSISAEFFVYLIFVSAIIYVRKSNNKTVLLLLLSITSLIGILLGAGYLSKILLCSYGFFLGAATESIFMKVKYINISNISFSILEIICLIISLYLTYYLPDELTLMLSPIYAITIIVFAYQKGILSKYLNNKLLINLGNLSYSIYMTHALLVIVIKIALINILKVDNTTYDLAIIVFIPLTILISFFSYKYIQLKGKDFLYKLLNKEKNVPINNLL